MRILFAKAGVPNDRFDVFTAECLREVAANDPRATFDEETQELWLEVEPEDVKVG